MKVEKLPSVTCEKCGSYQIMLTDTGPECDECNRYMVARNDLLSFGIDISDDMEVLKIKKQIKEN